jgi:hypothetical protein
MPSYPKSMAGRLRVVRGVSYGGDHGAQRSASCAIQLIELGGATDAKLRVEICPIIDVKRFPLLSGS